MSESKPNLDVHEYVDISTGSLLIGDAAVDAHIEAGGNPADLRTIGEAICDYTITLDAVDYPSVSTNDYDRDALVQAGKHILSLLPDWHESPNRINQKVLRRASILGLIPSTGFVVSRENFGSIPGFNRALGLESRYRRNEYDKWTIQDLVDYVGNVVSGLPYNSSARDAINELARHDNGPSSKIIVRRLGSLSQAINLAGYVDTKTWDEDDYIEWGVRFMLANDGALPTSWAFNHLSPKRLSPSRRSIFDHFDTLSKYQARIRDEYLFEIERREAEHQQKMEEFNAELKQGLIPGHVIESAYGEKELIQAYARLKLLRAFIPDADDIRYQSVIRSSEKIIDAIQRHDSGISAGLIETRAADLGIFDDIWKFDGYLDKLGLPDINGRPFNERAPMMKAELFNQVASEYLTTTGASVSIRELFDALYPGIYSPISQGKIIRRVLSLPDCRIKARKEPGGSGPQWILSA